MTLRDRIGLILSFGYLAVLSLVLALSLNTVRSWYGTAWFINSDGYLATAEHVVHGGTSFLVQYKKKFYFAKVIGSDELNDVAILKIAVTDTTAIPLKQGFEDGDNVDVLGYPAIEMKGQTLKSSRGDIYLSWFSSSMFTSNTYICKGSSGSPVVNSQGEAVGVLTKANMFWSYENGKCSIWGKGPLTKYLIELANRYKVKVKTAGKQFRTFKEISKYYKTNDSVVIIYGYTK